MPLRTPRYRAIVHVAPLAILFGFLSGSIAAASDDSAAQGDDAPHATIAIAVPTAAAGDLPDAAASEDDTSDDAKERKVEDARDTATASATDDAPAPNLQALAWPPIRVLGKQVEPGEKRSLPLRLTDSFAGAALSTPVIVIHGVAPGPIVCLTGGIHGDEINGMEIVRRVVERVEPSTLRGTVIGVPIVNLHGFQRGSRYLPDRRDLNRFFPGNAYGSSASRIAHLLFHKVVTKCEALVDYHTGSLHRTNLPQVRGDLADTAVRRLAERFDGTVVVHNEAKKGTIRRAAMDVGIPAIIYEAGEPMRLQEGEIARGVEGTLDLLAALELLSRDRPPPQPQAIYHETRWVRANHGGLLHPTVGLGDEVRPGDILGYVIHPVQQERAPLRSRHAGRVIGMTVSPIMIPGYAAFHIGVESTHPSLEAPPPATEPASAPDEEKANVGPADDTAVGDPDHDDESPEELPEDERPE